uniref:NADH-ubiquinone oxidoreductase chain 4 n=1 Tax=Heteropsylla cubana TaxID=121849 RepID=A0A344A2D9_9HEMI|nr:NADH dehydrogenase subunit 4 [Heteropsylla sp. DMP-2018]AWU48930.1 NADH dehydrogenase subunit 4 [Heteropsylla sp. DMP-2018]
MLEILLGILFVVVLKDWFIVTYSMMIYILFMVFFINEGGEPYTKLLFIWLTIWLLIMMLMSVTEELKSQELLFIFIWLLISLYLAFFSDTLIVFYLGFEMSVIPILLILFGWGYQPDRMEAGFYMILYTMFFSLPLLLKIYYMNILVNFNNNLLNFFMFMMAFMVKFPMVGLHYWLPRAHVEAPVFGSMILAGVMLKLGGYGVYKLSLKMGDFLFINGQFLISFSLIGGIILSLICFMQSDLKLLIAYSSIIHMSIVLSGLLTLQISGLNGSLMMMVGHGFCSSGLFCLLGLTYNRSMTRSIIMNKGFIMIMPICSLWWFLFCASNISFPPCLNLPGEIFLFLSILLFNKNLYLLIILFSIFSSLYSIYLFSFSQQSLNWQFFSFKSFSIQELLMMLLHWIPLNLLILDLSVVSIC